MPAGLLAALAQARLEPPKFRRQISLDIANPHLDDAVVPRFQPGLAAGAVGDDRLRLVRIDEFDREPVHKGNEIRNVTPHRRLALELPGKPPVAGQRLDFAAVDAPTSALRGATLSASTGLTDARGIATVAVTGGLKTKFWLSARHLRADPVQVMVMVGEGVAGTIAVVPAASAGSSTAAAVTAVDVLLFDGASCAQMSLVTPPMPTAVMKVPPGTAAEFDIFSAVPNAVLGQGRDADGHLRSAGCIDVPGSTVVANDTLRVYLPLADLTPAPRSVFIVHGEPEPAETLAGLLRERTQAKVHVPEMGQEFELWT